MATQVNEADDSYSKLATGYKPVEIAYFRAVVRWRTLLWLFLHFD